MSLVFNDTSNLAGLIQACEDDTGLGDGAISGDTTLLKQFTRKLNEAYDEVLPYALSQNDSISWDDTNNTDFPIGTVSLVQGQNDYTVFADSNSLEILRIFKIAILQSASATDYVPLQTVELDDEFVPSYLSPNPSATGAPTKVLIKGNSFFFNVLPNYSATAGIKLYFEREQNRFVSTDTTKKPGIPGFLHPLLHHIASHAWLTLHRPASTMQITRLEKKIADGKQALDDRISMQHKSSNNMRPRIDSTK